MTAPIYDVRARRDARTKGGPTERVAAGRELRALGGVGKTPEGMLQVRVLDERRGVIRVRLVDRARCTGFATGARARARARLVVLRDNDTNNNTCNDKDSEA